MKHHLMQIAPLLVSFVIINAEICPQPSIKPVPFPPKYLVGNWTVYSCSESSLCRKDIHCPKYPCQEEGENIVLHARGYNETSRTVVKGKGIVTFTDNPGEYTLQNFLGLKFIDSWMLYRDNHFCIVYGCMTDAYDNTTPGAWIITKNDPNNMLNPKEIITSETVLSKNGLSMKAMQSLTYNNCDKLSSE